VDEQLLVGEVLQKYDRGLIEELRYLSLNSGPPLAVAPCVSPNRHPPAPTAAC
jgi:hypothetical protein